MNLKIKLSYLNMRIGWLQKEIAQLSKLADELPEKELKETETAPVSKKFKIGDTVYQHISHGYYLKGVILDYTLTTCLPILPIYYVRWFSRFFVNDEQYIACNAKGWLKENELKSDYK